MMDLKLDFQKYETAQRPCGQLVLRNAQRLLDCHGVQLDHDILPAQGLDNAP